MFIGKIHPLTTKTAAAIPIMPATITGRAGTNTAKTIYYFVSLFCHPSAKCPFVSPVIVFTIFSLFKFTHVRYCITIIWFIFFVMVIIFTHNDNI